METKNKIEIQDSKSDNSSFDAVLFMRQQRDLISKELVDLTPEQIIKHFEEVKKSSDVRPST